MSNADLSGADLRDTNLRDAILNGAKLEGADLQHADLGGAQLVHADLNYANLSAATLTQTDLSQASLIQANLQGAFLQYTKLRGASLAEADLRGANLPWADLSGSFLGDADLSHASLWQTHLDRALFIGTSLADTSSLGATLNGTVFEPRALPVIRGMATSGSLEFLTYNENPDALWQLRKQFEDGGFLTQERAVTYAIRHTRSQEHLAQASLSAYGCPRLRRFMSADDLVNIKKHYGDYRMNQAACVPLNVIQEWTAYLFDWVMFDWTCRYGMEPNRCLKLMGWVWLGSAVVFFAFMQLPIRSGIYRVRRHEYRSKVIVAEPRRIALRRPRLKKGKWSRVRYPLKLALRESQLVRVAACFSLMSAFNIGFRDMNFGRWIRLLTIREYDLKAVGWIRPIAGIQSLVSLAFIALWVLTYFGRPFAQ